MKFRATEEQIRQVILNAYRASEGDIPLGVVAFNFHANQFTLLRSISDAYVNGRLVNLELDECAPGVWRPRHDGEPLASLSTWAKTYPTWVSLFASAGCERIE